MEREVPGASNASSLQKNRSQGHEDGECILGPPNCGANGDASGCGCTCHAGWSTIERQDPLDYRHCSVKETVKVGTEQRVDGSRELEEELKTGGKGGAEESHWPLKSSLQLEDYVLIFLGVLAIGLLMHKFYTNRQQSRARSPDAWKTTSLSYPHPDQVVVDEGTGGEDVVQAHMPEEAFADYFMPESQQDQAHPPPQDTWRYWQQLLRRPSFARAMRAQEHDPMQDAQVVEIQPENRRIRGDPAVAEGG